MNARYLKALVIDSPITVFLLLSLWSAIVFTVCIGAYEWVPRICGLIVGMTLFANYRTRRFGIVNTYGAGNLLRSRTLSRIERQEGDTSHGMLPETFIDRIVLVSGIFATVIWSFGDWITGCLHAVEGACPIGVK